MKYDLIPVKMADIKRLQKINAGEGVERREPSYTVGGNVNQYSQFTIWRTYCTYGDQYGGS